MLREARRLRLPGTLLSRAFLAAVPLGLVSAVLALQATGPPPDRPVLVIVPPGSKLAVVERFRSAVRAPRHALLVADADRVVLEGGFEMLVDRSFSRAPAADLVVLVDGNPGRAEESFLMERRKTAKAILLPRDSPLAERVREGGSGGALILLGGSESIAPLLDALAGSSSPRAAIPPASETAAAGPVPTASPSSPSAAAAVESPPARTATPVVARVFDRYFSSSLPTPTPTPR